jgi:hypothetical protein
MIDICAIKLNKSLYPESAVNNAVNKFSSVGTLTMRNEGDCILVDIISSDIDQTYLEDEFYNYLIYIISCSHTDD